jgi:RimJ/RimL family protein N-acetyltransferase
MDYFAKQIEPRTKRFLIDPDINNPRAIHVYQKAGFKIVSEFTMEGGYFDQSRGVMMVKEL